MDATVYQNVRQSNVYILLNRETTTPDIECQTPDIENNIDSSINHFIPINEIHYDKATFNCIICYEDFSMQQLYSCIRCNECKLCLNCTLKIFNKEKCPVCQKNNPWCKKPNGKVVKNNCLKRRIVTVERNQTNVIRNRNNYSKCYTILLFVFFVTISYLWLKDKGYKL